MNKRKTRKKKINRKNRLAKEKVILEQLQKEALELKEMLIEQKKVKESEKNSRNIQIFCNTCNLLVPYILTAAITVGGFKLLGGGLPFIKDNNIKYKKYMLQYETNANVSMIESYEPLWSSFTDKLKIYYPWQKNDQGLYERKVRTFKVNALSVEFLQAVLKEDINFINLNAKTYDEEIQTSNSAIVDDTYHISAKLHYTSTSEVLTFKESDLKNMGITITELALILIIGAFCAFFREFNYFESIYDLMENYRDKVQEYDKIKSKYEKITKKILSLNGGNNYVR